jgi:ribonuclease-3
MPRMAGDLPSDGILLQLGAEVEAVAMVDASVDNLSSDDEPNQQLMTRLGYRFADMALVQRALTHRSRVNEQGEAEAHNERLEFLGDAVLDLVIGELLMRRLPDAREGRLSKLRAIVVSEASLAAGARALQLGDFLRLGRGEEQTGGREKSSILADALEALFGAVYLDGGFENASGVIRRLLEPLVEQAVAGHLGADYKTRLQELSQARLRQIPAYEVVDQRGPDHAKIFVVVVRLDGRELARAEGHSKKEAEQEAARLALSQLSAAS